MPATATTPIPISRSGTGLPSRIITYGVEGIGKSSWAAMAPKPIFLMAKGETGLLSLIDSGQLGETDHFVFDEQTGRAEASTWNEAMMAIQSLMIGEHQNKTLVIDTLNGLEKLCFEHITQTKYGGNVESFLSYGKGPESSLPEWTRLLATLDDLRRSKRMAIICLAHAKIKTFKNPEGDDFDRYSPDMHDKTWGLAVRWADACLFGNYETFAKKDKGAMKAKGFDSGKRFFYCQRTAAYDAKNRLGLPSEIPMGDSPQEAWENFFKAAKAGRKIKSTEQVANGAA